MLEDLIEDIKFSFAEKTAQRKRDDEKASINAATSYLDSMTPDQLEMWQRGQNAYNNAFKFSEPLTDEQLEDLYQTDREFKVIP